MHTNNSAHSAWLISVRPCESVAEKDFFTGPEWARRETQALTLLETLANGGGATGRQEQRITVYIVKLD